MLRWCLSALCLVGCASANVDDRPPDSGDNPPIDGPPQPIDGPDIDAAPVAVTLSQSADMTVSVGKSLACGVAAEGYTAENSWYRVFTLTDFGITGPLSVNQVTFGVQESAGTQQVQVKLGTYNGALGGNNIDTGLITALNSVNVGVPPTTTGQILSTPITATVPAGGKLVVEIFTPDHEGTTTHFYVGASAGNETAPGYLRAPDCGANQPASVKSLNASAGAIILSVNGTH